MGSLKSPSGLNLPAIHQQGEFLLYAAEDGKSIIRVQFHHESVWLSQAQMAELFQSTKQNIAKHLKAIFADGELSPDSVVNQQLTTANVFVQKRLKTSWWIYK